MIYKRLIRDTLPDGVIVEANSVLRVEDGAFIPFDPQNKDYQKFKQQIENDESQLEDLEGNLMTSKKAKDFLATLPR